MVHQVEEIRKKVEQAREEVKGYHGDYNSTVALLEAKAKEVDTIRKELKGLEEHG